MSEGFLGAAVGDPSYTGCFICGDKGHDFRSCPKRSSGKGSKGKKGGQVHFVDAMVFTVEEVPDTGECFQNLGDIEQPVPESEMAGYAVIDSGATATVCSVPALEALVNLKEVQHGKPVGLEVTREPVKRFKFGNGEHAYASSYVLLDQVLGERKIQLGMFTLDVEGVPVLLGMKTLRRLKAIIDFDRCLVVFAAVNPNLAIGLRRSRTGHLLLDLTQDWLSQGVHLDQIGSELKLHPEILCAEIKENEGVSAFMVVEDSHVPDATDLLVHVEPQTSQLPVDVLAVQKRAGEPALATVVEKSVATSQRIRSQTPSRMSTLKALLAFAALHGACVGNGSTYDKGILDSSSCGQGSSENKVEGQEGWHGAPFGAREGRGTGFEGPSGFRPSMLRESHPSSMLQGVAQRKQPIWVVDRLLQVSASTDLCSSTRAARDLPAVSTVGCRCQGECQSQEVPESGATFAAPFQRSLRERPRGGVADSSCLSGMEAS